MNATMSALVLCAPGDARVMERPIPVLGPGQALIEVTVAGVCGTDVELFRGTMPYLRSGETRYPLVPGHEWEGRVVAVADDVADAAAIDAVEVGDRVTGDTFLGCGDCPACRGRTPQFCASRYEVGVRGNWDGACARFLAVPALSLHALPAELPPDAGAFVEPLSCVLAGMKRLEPLRGRRIAVWGTGTLGQLAVQAGRASGAEVDVIGRDADTLELAQTLGAHRAHLLESAHRTNNPPGRSMLVEQALTALKNPVDAAIDATGAADVPDAAVRTVRPGGQVSLLGVPGATSHLDVVHIVHHGISVYGTLGGSQNIDEAINLITRGHVSVSPLIAARIPLTQLPHWLAQPSFGRATKVLVKPGAAQ